jgi:endonuclease/exonuclease/phosphatase family metal-dependent hydrolase
MGSGKENHILNYLSRKKLLAIGLAILSLSSLIPKASATPFNIATWNIEWLSSHGYPQFEQSLRQSQDFEKLAGYFAQLDASVVAIQEVDSKEALQKIVGTDYQIILSERSDARNSKRQFQNINQYTGFAVASHFKVTEYPDLDLNPEPNGKLRFGTHIAVSSTVNPKPIHFLSVHLKAGCQGKYKNSRSCRLLKDQTQILSDWIKSRHENQDSFVILGDFNHDLSYKNDWLFAELTRYSPTIQLASKKSKAICEVRSNRNPNATHRFNKLIDHIIVSPDLAMHAANQQPFSKNDVINFKLSDHCPLKARVEH